MANITTAEGSLTLVGNWQQEDIDLFLPVLKSWSFYGQYGIQRCDTPSCQRRKVSFSGCGRWDFGGTLESFHEWTLDWIQNHGPLTQDQYDAFLQDMAEKDLRIEVEFEEDGNEDCEEGKGLFFSDGERLGFVLTFCRGIEMDWKELGKKCFDAAVAFFRTFTQAAPKRLMGKWVKEYIRPSDAYLDYDSSQPDDQVYDFLEEQFSDDAFFYDEVLFNALKSRTPLKEDERLEQVYRYLDDEFGIDYKAELPDNFDKNLLKEQESDEYFDRWYQQL